MIEPHSAQLGASSWILNATFVAPSDSVTVPEPFEALAGAACPFPFVARTERPPALPAPTLGADAGTAGEPALPAVALFSAIAVSTATLAVGVSLGAATPGSAV